MSENAGSLTEFAAFMGVSAPYVSKLKRQGRLVMVTVDGKEMVDFELSKRLIRNTTDPAKAENGANAKPGAGSRAVLEVGTGNKLDLTYKQARTHEAAFRAKLTELEYRERDGLLVDAGQVRRAAVNVAAMARSAFEKIPDKLAERMAAESDAQQCHALLCAEIDLVLADLTGACRNIRAEDQGGDGRE